MNDPYQTEPDYRIDPAQLAAWTAANDRARRANYLQPNACTRAIYKASYR